MKIEQKTGQLETSPGLVQHQFRICASKKAFEILSAGLYSDKVSAIIRELSTNAADSHKDAGQTRPFEVHLPSTLEPYFSVRDFGTGLSDDKVHTLYTTYFDSNRTHSDDFTGGLGLGSKSPFSYIDQFTVSSRFNGTETHYACFIDDSGIPSVTNLNSEATSEPNGIEVKFPVKSTDFIEFRNKAVTVLGWFNPRPKILGFSTFKFLEHNYSQKTDKYGLLADYNGWSNLVMGNVAYRIDRGDLKLDVKQEALVTWGVHIFMPIGGVEVAANREKLSYTKQTVATLTKFIDEITTEICKDAIKAIDDAPNVWEARIRFGESKSGFVGQFMPDKINYKNQTITNHIIIKEYKNAPTIRNITNSNYRSRSRHYHRDMHSFYVDRTKVFINDLPGVGAITRLTHQIELGKFNSAYLLTLTPPSLDPNDKRPDFSETGMLDVAEKISSLPKPPKAAPGTKPARDKAKLMKLKSSVTGYSAGDGWEAADTELAKGGVYLEIFRFVGMCGKKSEFNLLPSHLLGLVGNLATLGQKLTIFGIRPSDKAKLDKYKDKWINLYDYIKDFVEKNPKLFEESKLLIGSYNLQLGVDELLVICQDLTGGKSDFAKFADKVVAAHKFNKSKEHIAMVNIVNTFRLLSDDDTIALEKERKKLWDTYSLLKHVNFRWHTDIKTMPKAIATYIKAIDDATQPKTVKPVKPIKPKRDLVGV